MTDIDLKSLLLEELGYANSPGFRPSISWPNERPIPGVDSAFFVQNIPVAYFSRLEDVDSDRLRELHRDVWNQCKVPILYVVLPQEIKVYNGYAEPPRPSEYGGTKSQDSFWAKIRQNSTVRETRAYLFRYTCAGV